MTYSVNNRNLKCGDQFCNEGDDLSAPDTNGNKNKIKVIKVISSNNVSHLFTYPKYIPAGLYQVCLTAKGKGFIHPVVITEGKRPDRAGDFQNIKFEDITKFTTKCATAGVSKSSNSYFSMWSGGTNLSVATMTLYQLSQNGGGATAGGK